MQTGENWFQETVHWPASQEISCFWEVGNGGTFMENVCSEAIQATGCIVIPVYLTESSGWLWNAVLNFLVELALYPGAWAWG